MKNEDKGKRKYIGAVVVIALLAGIGLASAWIPGITPGTCVTTNWTSIVQNDPNSNALYVNDTFVHQGDTAVIVNFMNPIDLDGAAYGVHATGAHKTNRGANIGVSGRTSLDFHQQNGSAIGTLAYSAGYYDAGYFYGVTGSSIPNSLDNYGPTSTSRGVGGRFIAGPDDTHNLTLDATGTYWVGGVYGEVEGDIDGTPTAGAVAGVIGIDNTTGTAPSYAGYFDGRVIVTDLPPGSYTDEIVVADPDGVLRNSGKNMSALGADADWELSGDNVVTGHGGGYPTGNVGIGGVGAPEYKAYVNKSSGESGATGLFAEVASPSSTSNRVYGVRGSATSTGHGYHYGVYGKAYRSIGSEAGRAYGVSGLAGNAHSGYNYGVYGRLAGTQDGAAIYGTVDEGDVKVDGQWAGYFNGNVHVSDSVGIGTTDPQRALHVNDVLRLEPRTTAPSNPSEGDMYMDGTTHKLMVYDGAVWQACW